MIPAVATIDPEQERRRLAEFYAYQMDGELEKVAGQAYELTDTAREALRAEMARRGLSTTKLEGRALTDQGVASVSETEEPVSNESVYQDQAQAEFRDLVTIRTFWNLLEAELAKGLLEAAGIECFLSDSNMVRMDWFNANALGGVKLRVDPDNVGAANRILDDAVLENSAPDELDSPD